MLYLPRVFIYFFDPYVILLVVLDIVLIFLHFFCLLVPSLIQKHLVKVILQTVFYGQGLGSLSLFNDVHIILSEVNLVL